VQQYLDVFLVNILYGHSRSTFALDHSYSYMLNNVINNQH